jgi:hypothetical protein
VEDAGSSGEGVYVLIPLVTVASSYINTPSSSYGSGLCGVRGSFCCLLFTCSLSVSLCFSYSKYITSMYSIRAVLVGIAAPPFLSQGFMVDTPGRYDGTLSDS